LTSEQISKRCTCSEAGRRLGVRCPKLRRPGGSWSPHHGTWRYQLELPAVDGRRRQLRRGGFPDRTAAVEERDHAKTLLKLAGHDDTLRAEIAAILLDCRPGVALPDAATVTTHITRPTAAGVQITMADYLDTWLAARRGLAGNTLRCYGDHIRLYLTPHLGHHTVADLDLEHVEDMFTALIDRSAAITTARQSPDPKIRATVRGVRPMGASSIQRVRATLRKALNDAIHKHRLRTTNPAVGVELASGKPPKARVWTDKAMARWEVTGAKPSPVMVWKPAQAGQFLDYTETHDPALHEMFTLILHRGLRRGEACALRDEDVDLDAGTLTIVYQLTTVGYETILKEVKSEAGDRVIPLGPATIAVLQAYLARRRAWAEKVGDTWPDTGLFFVRPDGQPWHPAAVSDRFERHIIQSGLPPVRLHDLRHCAATYLRHGGADMKEIQETLGHATLGITSDIYTSVILELRNTNADAAANLIPRAGGAQAA
jgi:integrase